MFFCTIEATPEKKVQSNIIDLFKRALSNRKPQEAKRYIASVPIHERIYGKKDETTQRNLLEYLIYIAFLYEEKILKFHKLTLY